jgi:polyisoprenoid-binding protein YceI
VTDAPATPNPTPPPSPSPKSRRPIVWIVVAVVVALVLFVGGPFVYINVIKEDAPAPLALPTNPGVSTTASSSGQGSGSGSGSSDGVDGSWTVAEGTTVGYRVEEVLFGQSTEGVGRTSEVDGTMTIDGTQVTDVDLTVDMASVTSDSNQRDGQFNSRIMETSTHPTATFVLTAPIDLGSVPADGEAVTVSATGDLTLKGTTRSVTFDLKAQRAGGTISVNGAIPITFADYGIDNPSGGPAQVGDTGTLELLVVFAPA